MTGSGRLEFYLGIDPNEPRKDTMNMEELARHAGSRPLNMHPSDYDVVAQIVLNAQTGKIEYRQPKKDSQEK